MLSLCVALFGVGMTLAQAQLAVTISPVKVTGSMAQVKFELKNKFAVKVESARAVCFLLDEQGKVVGQYTQWVIGGGEDRPVLAPDAATTFNFVVPTDKPFSKTKVTFARLILEGGKSVDVNQNAKVEQ